MNVKKEKVYITKDSYNAVEIWRNVPKYDGECWDGDKDDIGGEIYDDDLLNDIVEPGQCAELEITVKEVVFDYNKSPEGRLMHAIFGK